MPALRGAVQEAVYTAVLRCLLLFRDCQSTRSVMVSSVCGTQLNGSLVAIPVAALAMTRVGTAFPCMIQQWISMWCDDR